MAFGLVLLGGLAASPTHAQLIAGPGMNSKPQAAKPAVPPPPALPGAQSDERSAPMDKASTDMPPTDALFDAINHGDIASARDAIARGADLDAQNLLGMTPLELSVDLGRNNITFLLLSMHGDSGAGSATRKVAKAPAAAEKHAARPERTSRSARVQRAAVPGDQDADTIPTTPTTRSPRRGAATTYAGDGGAPIPSAGFLGFDNGNARSSR